MYIFLNLFDPRLCLFLSCEEKNPSQFGLISTLTEKINVNCIVK